MAEILDEVVFEGSYSGSGKRAVVVSGTGPAVLEALAADGTTWVTASSLATGYHTVEVMTGFSYRFNIPASTRVNLSK